MQYGAQVQQGSKPAPPGSDGPGNDAWQRALAIGERMMGGAV
jgi:hypothetical protein